MTHSPSKNSTHRLIIERMHFNNFYIVLLWLLLIDVFHIVLMYIGSPQNNFLTDIKESFTSLTIPAITFIIIQFGVIYFALAVRKSLNKIHEILEIDSKNDSSLRSLFVSENAVLKYINQFKDNIFSKWQLRFSIFPLIFGVVVFAFYFFEKSSIFGVPYKSDDLWIWQILMVLYYILWWILLIAGFSLAWALLCIVTGLMQLKNAEGLKIKESIKSFETVVNIKQYDGEAVKKSLDGYYTYNRFLMDSWKITDFSLYFAVMVAILGILFSVNSIFTGNWIWYSMFLPIFIDIIAVIIFIVPLIGIHGVLKATKSEIYNITNDVYEHKKIDAIAQYASLSHADEDLIKSITFLRGTVDETNSLKTWPIDMEAIIRLTVTTIVPILLMFVSKISELIGNR